MDQTDVTTIASLLLVDRHADVLLVHTDPLVAAAAALAAGEPRTARTLVDGLHEPAIAAMIAAAATIVELNRYPGGSGAQMSTRDMVSASTSVSIPLEPRTRLVALVALRLLPDSLSGRRIADDMTVLGQVEEMAVVSRWFDDLIVEFERLPGGSLVLPYVRLAQADVARRTGQWPDAAHMLADARRRAGDDLVTLADLALAEGDWAMEPFSHPECLGLDLLGRVEADLGRGDPTAALAAYARAHTLYRAAGAGRGLAALALRRAHVARRVGDLRDRDRELVEGRRLCMEVGEHRLVHLIDLHGLIDRITAGEPVPAAEADTISAWAARAGGTAFASGCVLMLVAQAARLRDDGAVVPAHAALRTARRLAPVATPAETEVLGRAAVELTDRINVQSTSVVFHGTQAARAVHEMALHPSDRRTWVLAAQAALLLNLAAQKAADPEFVQLAGRRLAEVASAIDVDDPLVAQVQDQVQEAAAASEILRLRYEARAAQAAGQQTRSIELLEQALARTDLTENRLLRAVLLLDLDRRKEAAPLVVDLVTACEVSTEAAATLLLRSGQGPAARELLGGHPLPGNSDRPWEPLTLLAEAALAGGDAEGGAQLAAQAVQAFEAYSAGLLRDAYRTAATDQVPVAAAYHAGVLAHVEIASRANGRERSEHLAAAFDFADRCRGTVVQLVQLIDGLSTVEQRTDARRWLRAGAEVAAVYEGLVDGVLTDSLTADPVTLGGDVLRAETALDEAEAQARRSIPLIAGRPRPNARLSARLDEVRGTLTDGAVLLYQTFDDDLVIWLVDPEDGVRCERLPVRARDLAAAARSFHNLCRTGVGGSDVATDLARKLLGPIGDSIRRRRLSVVPHNALALVPFHALPHGDDLLGTSIDVSVLPSAGLLTRPDASRRPRFDRPALLVGDAAYAPDTGLAPLPGTATEVAAIAALLESDSLTGENATAESFRSLSRDRRIVVMATHGVINERRPHLSYLALAGEDRLLLADVFDLSADLVVFSACDTGRGTATAGGDVVGLARAALAAGARHVVASLWPVRDLVGCLIVTTMFERLVAGCDIGAALNAARNQVRGWDEATRAERYEALGQVGMPSTPDLSREIGPTEPFNRDYAWAPFIHIGV